jgi:two-component system, OmpR family, response regulator CpxR
MKPKRTILCVDDDERSLSIRKVLLETRGYRVLTCTEPQHALEIMQRGGIDLVLADLMMPKISGAKLIDQIKAISPQTPALLFSGSVNCCSEDTLADGWLPKGALVPMELLERIRVLLIRKRGPKRFVALHPATSLSGSPAHNNVFGSAFSATSAGD